MHSHPVPKLAFLVALALFITGCERKVAPGAASVPAAARLAGEPAWAAFTGRFIEGYFALDPFFAVSAGRHEFDGRMPDWSAAGIQKKVDWLKQTRAQATGIAGEAMTGAQRLEREHLLSVIDGELFWTERARVQFRNPEWYIDRLDPSVYLSREYAPLAQRLAGYIGYARAVPRLAADIRANLQMPLPKSFIERGIAGFGGYGEFYRSDVPKVFAAVEDAELQRQLAEANAAAAAAMEDLKKWFESGLEQGADGFALGPELFQEMLQKTERVDVPLSKLREIGRADLQRNLAALQEACASYLPRAPLRVCIDSMNAKKPEAGAVAGARDQLASLREFVVAKRLATIPGAEEALVEESPAYNRGNSAYILIPGPYEKGLPSVYYIAPPDAAWSPAERAAYIPGKAELLFTTVHEVWPGHFLQFLHANRNPSKVQALWVGYAYAEGWAHYAEEMMWEAGLGDGDPEIHIGQLTNALLRNVRFVSAIGLHTEGMTIRQSEQMFRDSAFQDPGNARQQAARGTYDPAYLNYTLGKLMIRKLREDWLARQTPSPGPQQRWGEFHDRFLAFGGPPIPVVRKEMIGEGGSLF